MSDDIAPRHSVHRYHSVTEGVAMANEYLSSRLSMSEFARQKGVSFKMVKHWSARARQLAAEAGSPASPPARSGSMVPIGTIDECNVIVVTQPPTPAETTSHGCYGSEDAAVADGKAGSREARLIHQFARADW